MASQPGLSASNAPLGPRYTSRTWGESGSIVMSTSVSAATPAGVARASAPSATSTSTAERSRSWTVSRYPARSRLRPIGRPMIPRPIRPSDGLVSILSSSSQFAWLLVAPRVMGGQSAGASFQDAGPHRGPNTSCEWRRRDQRAATEPDQGVVSRGSSLRRLDRLVGLAFVRGERRQQHQGCIFCCAYRVPYSVPREHELAGTHLALRRVANCECGPAT